MADKDILLHDAKNCLHALTVNLEAMEDGLVPLTAAVIQNLNQSLLVFQNILRQLIKGTAPKKSFTEDSFDIVPLLKRLVKEMAPLFDKKGIIFSFSILATEIYIHADAMNFERMVRNLLSNEEKYVPSGGCIEGNLSRDGASRARITFIDNGPGIAPQSLKDIFKRSQRGTTSLRNSEKLLDETFGKNDRTRKNKETDTEKYGNSRDVDAKKEMDKGTEEETSEGSGLGLYQVGQTVESIGGSIEIINRDAGGLQIILSFPVDTFLA